MKRYTISVEEYSDLLTAASDRMYSKYVSAPTAHKDTYKEKYDKIEERRKAVAAACSNHMSPDAMRWLKEKHVKACGSGPQYIAYANAQVFAFLENVEQCSYEQYKRRCKELGASPYDLQP